MAKRISSIAKGKRNERLAAAKLQELLNVPCRRGVQYAGSPDSPDVVMDKRIHLEIKACEALNINNAVLQAVKDSRETQVPVVLHKKNHKDWLCTFRLDDIRSFVSIIHSIMKDHSLEDRPPDIDYNDDSPILPENY